MTKIWYGTGESQLRERGRSSGLTPNPFTGRAPSTRVRTDSILALDPNANAIGLTQNESRQSRREVILLGPLTHHVTLIHFY